jgi:hypothetical protein
MTEVKLKFVEAAADFRKSEHTNFLAVQKGRDINLGAGEAVLLVSRTGKQLVFVYSARILNRDGKVTTTILPSLRYRIVGPGTWNPLMLQNYAEEVGLHLKGVKRYEDIYRMIYRRKS